MNRAKIFWIILMCSATTRAGGLQITSLSAGGRLTWTNAFTNGLFTVQWASSLSSDWHDDWAPLQDFMLKGQTGAVDLPVFYRVKCVTNLFFPLPLGSVSIMSVSNAVGNVWTQQTTVVGSMYFPSKGKTYSILEMLNPINPPNAPLIAVRSTESELYTINKDTGAEYLGFRAGPVGTTWTVVDEGRETQATIEASEPVTVAAGTFNCLRVRKQRLNASHPNPVWIEWWARDFGLVKWIDYYVDAGENPPIVYELKSQTVNAR